MRPLLRPVLPLLLAPSTALAAPATEAEMNLYTRIAAVNVCIARGAEVPFDKAVGIAGETVAQLIQGQHDGVITQVGPKALSLDEPNGLNLMLAGEADAAVVPSQRAVPLLQRDPRLTAVLPASGSPLWWQLLVRIAPVRADQAMPPLPLEWLRDGLSLPLLDRLLAAGWVPPLPQQQLQPALARWPERLRPLLLPPAAVLARCSSLPPLSAPQQQRWQLLWDQALSS